MATMSSIPETLFSLGRHLEVFEGSNTTENVRYFVEELNNLVDKISKLSSNQIKKVHSLIVGINSLHSDEYELKKQLREGKIKLQSAETDAYTFVDTVGDFLRFADLDSGKVQEIEEAAKRGNLGGIKNYIAQIRGYLETCTKRYKEFTDSYEEAKELCDVIASKCDAKKSEARNKSSTAYFFRIMFESIGITGVAGSGAAWYYNHATGTVITVILIIVGFVVFWFASSMENKFGVRERAFQNFSAEMIVVNTKVDDLGSSTNKIKKRMLTTGDRTTAVERQRGRAEA